MSGPSPRELLRLTPTSAAVAGWYGRPSGPDRFRPYGSGPGDLRFITTDQGVVVVSGAARRATGRQRPSTISSTTSPSTASDAR
jgi:hypothetical protein